MNNIVNLYKQRLNLQSSAFSLINHDDAIVAIVYKVTQSDMQYILKICTRVEDFLREVHFLKFFTDKCPVPKIIQIIKPELGINGAILMEYLPGTLLNTTNFTNELAYEIGSLLAQIHKNHTLGYGDLTQSNNLSSDPQLYFAAKFEENFAECSNHLPKTLLEQCRRYYDAHINLLNSVDGPCLIHRDFRPGNIIIHNNKLQGIIDWSSGRAGFAQEDFCFIEDSELPINSSIKNFFLDGYKSIRPVPHYITIMPLLQLNRALAVIGFTVKRKTWKSSNATAYQNNLKFLEAFFKQKSKN